MVDYVLTPFTSAEETMIPDILAYSAKAAIAFATNGPEFAMNHFNGPVPRENLRHDLKIFRTWQIR